MSDMDKDTRESLRIALVKVQSATALLGLAAAHCASTAERGEPEGEVPHLGEVYQNLRDAMLAVCERGPTFHPAPDTLSDFVGATGRVSAAVAMARVVDVGSGPVVESLWAGDEALRASAQRALLGVLLAELTKAREVTPDVLWQALAGCAASQGLPLAGGSP